MNYYETILDVLKQDERFFAEDGVFLRNAVYEAAMQMDEALINLLLSNDRTKTLFFKEVSGVKVFDKVGFGWVINNRQILQDSYTRFKNKIGLADEKEKLITSNEGVQLVFPYKDCTLEFDSTKEDDERNEVFFNEMLAPEEIDRLLAPKVLTNATIINSEESDSIDTFDESNNLFIKGNNLIALHSLAARYCGRIKMMYWDILYNTNSDKVPYNDSFKHSSWLVMMKNRLEVAKTLLSKDGLIAIQCDDNEMAYLKVLCDEIFGRANKLSTITIKVKAPAGVGQESFLFDVNEYILVYAKDLSTVKVFPYKEKDDIAENTFSQYNSIITIRGKGREVKTLNSERNGEFPLIEYDDFEVNSIPASKRNSDYYRDHIDEIVRTTNPQGGLMKKLLPQIPKKGLFSITYKPSKGGKSDGTITYYFLNGALVVWLKDSAIVENNQIYKLNKMTNLWTDNFFQGISNEGGVTLNAGKKPERLLERIIRLCSQPGDIVLDAFFGTGTTGAVAMKLSRRFIGIEQLDSHCEKARNRLSNVIAGDQTGISRDVDWHGGGSYIYCELAKQNQKVVEEIEVAKNDRRITELYNRIVQSGFLSYKVNPDTIEDASSCFDALSFDNKKRFLMEILDKNLLYLNYCDIEDEEFEVSELDKAFTKSFYGKE